EVGTVLAGDAGDQGATVDLGHGPTVAAGPGTPSGPCRTAAGVGARRDGDAVLLSRLRSRGVPWRVGSTHGRSATGSRPLGHPPRAGFAQVTALPLPAPGHLPELQGLRGGPSAGAGGGRRRLSAGAH